MFKQINIFPDDGCQENSLGEDCQRLMIRVCSPVPRWGRRELTLANCLLASIHSCAMPQLPETPKVNTCDTTVGEKSTG